MRKLLLLTAASLFLALPVKSWATVVFTDGSFPLGNYLQVQGLVNGGAGITASDCATCGLGNGAGLNLAAVFPTAPTPGDLFTTVEVLLNDTFFYDPGTEGDITSLTTSVDKNLGVSIALTGGTNTYHPTIVQDGSFYVASIPGPTLNCPTVACETGFNSLSATLTAADFLLFDPASDTFGTATPNFSGDPMEFGLTQIFGSGAAETIFANYDNLSFTINPPITAAPEPGAITLLIVGLFGMVMVKRRGNAMAA